MYHAAPGGGRWEEFLLKVHTWSLCGSTDAHLRPGAPTPHQVRSLPQAERSLHPPGTPGDSSKERTAQSLRDKRGLHPGLLPAVGRDPDPAPCLCSEEPPLDLTGKVYQLEVMLKQLHTDLQKVRPPGSCLTWHFSDAWGLGRWAARLGLPSPPPSRLF